MDIKLKITRGKDQELYLTAKTMNELVDILQRDTSTLLHWFDFNDMKTNAAKSNLLVSNDDNISIKIENETINGQKS